MVAHAQGQGFAAADHRVAEADGDGAVVLRELDGVGQQVLDGMVELLGVDHGDGAGGAGVDGERDVALGEQGGEVGLHAAHENLHVGSVQREVHAPGFELGEVEQVIDEIGHAAAALVDAFEVIDDFFVRGLAGAGCAESRIGQDAVQRRAEFVGHVGQELALQQVGPLGGFLGADQVGGLGGDEFGEMVAVLPAVKPMALAPSGAVAVLS